MMTRAVVRPVVVLLALAAGLIVAPRAARATSADCARSPDGTPCDTDCITDGLCMAGRCTGGQPVGDGTPCATGLLCTAGDRCMQGACIAGGKRDCPRTPCDGPAHCVEKVGCVPDAPCNVPLDLGLPADLAPPLDGGDDLASNEVWKGDLASPIVLPDGGSDDADVTDAATDDGPGPADDFAMPSDDAAADDAGVPDDAGATDDASVPDDGGASDDAALGPGEDKLLHVHGSGCVVGAGAAPPPIGLLLGALLLAFARWRRRHAA